MLFKRYNYYFHDVATDMYIYYLLLLLQRSTYGAAHITQAMVRLMMEKRQDPAGRF